jgi:predicted ester cyclase
MKPRNIKKSKLATVAALGLLGAGTAIFAFAQPASKEDLPKPKMLILDKSLSKDRADKSVHAARLFYAFWNTGNSEFAKNSLAADFTDRTLPKGRPQGIEGPIFASSNFRKAVPDLSCEIEQMIVCDDRVVSHLHFSGHFSGVFGQKNGTGQSVDFIATDILRIQNGRITDNWHLEDNLTLMQQLGIVQP